MKFWTALLHYASPVMLIQFYFPEIALLLYTLSLPFSRMIYPRRYYTREVLNFCYGIICTHLSYTGCFAATILLQQVLSVCDLTRSVLEVSYRGTGVDPVGSVVLPNGKESRRFCMLVDWSRFETKLYFKKLMR